MTAEKLRELLQVALGALADIGLSQDMTVDLAQRKANRVYQEIQKQLDEE